MIYIGIDPGMKGGWTVISDDVIDVHIWDEQQFISNMREISDKKVVCCLEKVGAMPKQGVSSTFKFGEEYGKIQGVLTALGIPYQTVTPQAWKKEYNLIGTDKTKSIETAQRLFPNANLYPTPRCRKPSDGMAESLLMAEYARRRF